MPPTLTAPSAQLAGEAKQLKAAGATVAAALRSRAETVSAQVAEVLSATAMMVTDSALHRRAKRLMRDGLSTERALCDAAAQVADPLTALGGSMAERAADVLEARSRALVQLRGVPAPEQVVAEQTRKYQRGFEAVPGRRVAVRPLDPGADEPLPLLTDASEPHPALAGGLIGLDVSSLSMSARSPAVVGAVPRIIAHLDTPADEAMDASSIMSPGSLRAEKGDTVVLRAEGDDAERVLDELVDVLEQNLVQVWTHLPPGRPGLRWARLLHGPGRPASLLLREGSPRPARARRPMANPGTVDDVGHAGRRRHLSTDEPSRHRAKGT